MTTKPLLLWPLQKECFGRFGNPSAPGFQKKWLVPITPPFRMHMGDVEIHHFMMNKICADSINRVLANIWDACEHDQNIIAREHGDKFSGSFAVRTIRGGHTTSMHAYGLAIDLNAENNQLG